MKLRKLILISGLLLGFAQTIGAQNQLITYPAPQEAELKDDFTVKVLHNAGGCFKLRAGNPTYPDIVPKENQELEIWGVVKSCIKRFA